MLLLMMFSANHVINSDYFDQICDYLPGFVAQLDELDMVQDNRTKNFNLVLNSVSPKSFDRHRYPYC